MIEEDAIMDPTRRKILKAGAAAMAMAAAPSVFAQQTGQGGAAMSFKGEYRYAYARDFVGSPACWTFARSSRMSGSQFPPGGSMARDMPRRMSDSSR
jgi:hypothetical protein